jgi:hypothetical protein
MNALRDHLRRHLTWPRVVFTLILLLWVKKFLAVEPYTQGEVKPNGQYQRVFARLDGHYIHLERMSLFFDGDLDLSNQLATWGDPLGTKTLPTTTGKNYLYPVGSALLELPAFAIAHGVAKVRNAFGDDLPMHGYDRFHQRWTFFSGAARRVRALLVGYRLARRHASETAALFAVARRARHRPVLLVGVPVRLRPRVVGARRRAGPSTTGTPPAVATICAATPGSARCSAS